MPYKPTFQPLSSYIRPLYQKWSHADATEKQILQEFREMLAKDFNEVDTKGHEEGFYSDKKNTRNFIYNPVYYKHKDEKNIFAAVVTVALRDDDFNPDNAEYPKITYEHKLYDVSLSIQHYHHGIISHEAYGECLTTPVPNWAEHITIAENGLVTLRPCGTQDNMGLSTVDTWPLLNGRKNNGASFRP